MSDKLHILIPDGFVSEKTYVLDILLKDYLNLSYSTEINTSTSEYIFILPNGNQLILKNEFFKNYNEKHGYLKIENLPVLINGMTNDFTPEQQMPIIYGTDEISVNYRQQNKVLYFGLDIIASTFFMLTRWEEYVNPARDEYHRFPAEASCAVKHDFLHRPIVNEYCYLLQKALNFLGFADFSPVSLFKIVPTHDVDRLLYFDGFSGFTKKITCDIFIRRSLPQAKSDLSLYWQILKNKKHDPYNTYDELMTISEENNSKSIFYFLTGFNTKLENSYTLISQFGKKLINSIEERGHEIGLHPGFNSQSNNQFFYIQLKKLQPLLKNRIIKTRQHFLQFSLPETWRIADNNHMQVDSTLGYSEAEGFRSGTCIPYQVYDFINRKKLNLKESPLIAMDTTLVYKKKYSPEKCYEQLSNLVKTVKRYNGEFVILWHNSNWESVLFHNYREVYKTILKFR